MAVGFTPPTYNATVWDAFRAKTLLNPPSPLSSDPYEANPPINTTWPTTPVCAVVYPNEPDRTTYLLKTFASRSAAEAYPGAFVTHDNPCNLCSSVYDLATYMAKPDLTAPSRDCGLLLAVDQAAALRCFQDIGFTLPCAQIWMYDAKSSGRPEADGGCRGVCLKAWIEHTPPCVPVGSYHLNDCLACDSSKSGPIFNVVAGRRRRNSGLISSIPRPPDSIYPVVHDYY